MGSLFRQLLLQFVVLIFMVGPVPIYCNEVLHFGGELLDLLFKLALIVFVAKDNFSKVLLHSLSFLH